MAHVFSRWTTMAPVVLSSSSLMKSADCKFFLSGVESEDLSSVPGDPTGTNIAVAEGGASPRGALACAASLSGLGLKEPAHQNLVP